MDFGSSLQGFNFLEETNTIDGDFLLSSDLLQNSEPHTDEIAISPTKDKDEIERNTKLQSLENALLKEKKKLELNHMLQDQLYQQIQMIELLLKRNQQQEKQKLTQLNDISTLNKENTTETSTNELESLSKQYLLSFPIPSSPVYFSKRRKNYLHFVSSDGKYLPVSTKTSNTLLQRWSPQLDKLLTDAVLKQCHQLILLDSVPSNLHKYAIQYQKEQDEDKKLVLFHKLIPSLIRFLSWESISHDIGHSATDCFIHWLNCCDPFLNHDDWSLDEDTRLQVITEKYHKHNWIQIACELKTNRAPIQCYERYVRVIEMKNYNRKWTKEEDTLILEGVKTYGKKHWTQIATTIPGRTWRQCCSRYYQSLVQSYKKGRWSDLENCRFLLILYFIGMDNWRNVSNQMATRNVFQCRDRWVNVLHPNNTKNPWTRQEDRLLLSLCKKMTPIVWKKIYKQFPGRTADSCKTRYNTLCRTF